MPNVSFRIVTLPPPPHSPPSLLLEMYAPEVYKMFKMFVYKHTEATDYVKK